MMQMLTFRSQWSLWSHVLALTVSAQGVFGQQTATLSLDPASGPPGQAVQATGSGFFDSVCGVDFHWDSPSGPLLGSASVDNGSFVECVSTPLDAMPGEHAIFAVGLAPETEFCEVTVESGQVASATITILSQIDGPFVGDPVTPFEFTGDLGDLPVADPWRPGDPFQVGRGQAEQPCAEQEDRSAGRAYGEREADGAFFPDRGQPDERGAFMTPTASFDGIPATGFLPPDTVGDVGPNHYIQMVNSRFAIYDKQGNLLAGPSLINQLWNDPSVPATDACRINNDGDPDVKYDAIADRWVLTQFVAFTNECIAVSKTPDPVSGGWWLYNFPTSGVANDYPKFGVWPDAYYMGSQRGFPSSGSDAWAFDRANMLNGNPAAVIRFFDGGRFMLPSDLDGATLPPAGAPNVFARLVDGADVGGVDRLELREFSVDWAVPANSTFTALPDLPTAAFDRNMCGLGLFGACIPQPGTTNLLSSFTGWLLARLQYRNFGTYQTLVVNHTVDVDGTDRAGNRWYELRKNGGAWSIFQQGTHSPDATHRWMGSVAMDQEGNMALGYSVASGTEFPGIRYGGRLAGDPAGTMPQGEVTLIAGGGSQIGFCAADCSNLTATDSFAPCNPGTCPAGETCCATPRWGDYSSMNVDPEDDCTFWYTTEYYATTSSAGWQTRIGAFRFMGCGNEPPVCEAGGPYTGECEGTTTQIQLDASGSSDPDMDALTFSWSTNCPGGTFDDPTLEGPTLTVNSVAPCPLVCEVSLTVDDGNGGTDSCSATVTVQDTTDPDLTCPADVSVACGEPTDPTATGSATATDDCDAAPAIVSSDVVLPSTCPADPVQEVVERTWIATDACGNTSSCTQNISVLKTTLRLDIKPGSCPNSYNRDSHGVLPVGLLGTADFDVHDVDQSSIRLSRADCVGGSVAPHEGPPGPHTVVSDVGTPFSGVPCHCHELTGDGFRDLSLKFKTDDVVSALELGDLPAGALVELVLSGELADGCQFIASDCVRLVPPQTPPGQVAVHSNLSSAWVDVNPPDLQLEGGGFGSFVRTFPLTTIATLTAEDHHGAWRFVGWRRSGDFTDSSLSVDIEVLADSISVDAVFGKPADLSGDDDVDLADFAQFALCFGSTWGDLTRHCSMESMAESDLDRSGQIDLEDFRSFVEFFGD